MAVRLPQDKRSIASLAATPIPTPDGGYAALGSVANIRETSGAMNISREAGKRTMAVGIFIKDRDMGSVVADMKARGFGLAYWSFLWLPELKPLHRHADFVGIAREIGMVSEVVPRDELRERADWCARVIADSPPLVIQGTMRALWTALEVSRKHANFFVNLGGGTARDALALIERVEPNCAIDTVTSHAARASRPRPAPSWPNSSTARSGKAVASRATSRPSSVPT